MYKTICVNTIKPITQTAAFLEEQTCNAYCQTKLSVFPPSSHTKSATFYLIIIRQLNDTGFL